jgi:NADPH:quinone reductase-like Zn-dependent oxidoreductase
MTTLTRRDALLAVTAGVAGLPAVGMAAAPASRAGKGTFRAYQIGEQKGIESLTLVQRPDPAPGPGQVLVSVKAAALNNRDLSILAGKFLGPKPPERVPVADGAGEVVAVGDGVTRVKVGDRVVAVPFTTWMDGLYDPSMFGADIGHGLDGWLAEKIVLPANALVKLADEMSYEDAAALTAVGITSWSLLHNFGNVQPGDLVLTLGTGGVSMMVLQLAKMAGARVAITSSSDAKLETARKLGADITVNYRTHPDWEKQVVAQSGGRGADIVIETVGMATLNQSISACAPNARIGYIGSLGGNVTAAPNFGQVIARNITIKGSTSGSRRMLEQLHRAVIQHGTRPIIDKTFTFDKARDAFAYLAKGEHMGKIVIRVS